MVSFLLVLFGGGQVVLAVELLPGICIADLPPAFHSASPADALLHLYTSSPLSYWVQLTLDLTKLTPVVETQFRGQSL